MVEYLADMATTLSRRREEGGVKRNVSDLVVLRVDWFLAGFIGRMLAQSNLLFL